MRENPHTRSLSDFHQHADEVINYLDHSGEAEVLTINGEARAVLLSLHTFEELVRDALLTRDTSISHESKF